MDSRETLLNSIATLEERMQKQRERIAQLRTQAIDPAHAVAILDEMTKSFERLMQRLEGTPAVSRFELSRRV